VTFPTAHALLRDRRSWDGSTRGLAADAEGVLSLARVPAPADRRAVDIPTAYPYVREVSGIAAGACDALFVADTAHDRVLYRDGRCGAETWMPGAGDARQATPGSFRRPRGLAIGPDALAVADSGHGRVQRLAFPALEPHLAFTGSMEPVSVAVDAAGRTVVVDASAGEVHRIGANGVADSTFDNAVAAQSVLSAPLFVACDGANRTLVADGGANEVFLFDDAGGLLGRLPGPPGWLPAALAVFDRLAYVADASSGSIVVFEGDVLLGVVHGWRGPVTAMATAPDGTLFVKPGLDDRYYRFEPGAACLPEGELEVGPLDAGEDRDWIRAWIHADTPAGTSLDASVAVAGTTAAPTPGDWVPLPSADALLTLRPAPRRFAWLRLRLRSTSPAVSPRLRQARLATSEEDLREYLPHTFTRRDGETGLLARWLRLLGGEFGRIEEWLDDMPRLADPAFSSPAALPWLASWLALELPAIAGDDERRALLRRAVDLFARRGTAGSIAEFVELHTGIRPSIVEAFHDRRVWMLGVTSHLGFDTRLAPLDPLGMVVPDTEAGADCCTSAPADAPCSPCTGPNTGHDGGGPVAPGPIGRAVVGESGPLADHHVGLPLFAEDAYRFCVVVDAYRAGDPEIRQEILRIVDREKPAHTDARIAYVDAETRIGLQARVGIDAIVGGDPPPFRLGPAQLDVDTRLPRPDVARVGASHLDGTLTLT
jgi:phage tail-like protein